jgi:hypothetical protein
MSAEESGERASSNGAGDRIELTLPGSTRLRSVATLVLGGVGSRLDLPYERVDDLQLAVLSVLAASDLERVTIDIAVDDHAVAVSIGPLPGDSASDPGLRRVVERLVDAAEARPGDADGGRGDGDWLTLRLARTEHEPA